MAYDLFAGFGLKDKDDEDQPQLGQPALAAAPQSGGGGVATSQAAATGQAAPAGASSGKFVNFDRYLNANRTGAENMAKGTADKIEQQGNTAKDAQDALQVGFQTPINAHMQRNTQAAPQASIGVLPNSAQARPAAVQTQATGGLQTAMRYQEPVGAGLDADGYQNMAPELQHQSLADMQAYNTTQDLTAKAQAAANQTGTDAGLQALTQQANKNANYSGGMGRMDAALMGSVGNPRFADLRKKFGGLEQSLSGKVQQSSGQADAYDSWRTAENTRRTDENSAEKEKRDRWAAIEAQDKANADQAAQADKSYNDVMAARPDFDTLSPEEQDVVLSSYGVDRETFNQGKARRQNNSLSSGAGTGSAVGGYNGGIAGGQ